MTTMTNQDIANFYGDNQSLCERLGKFAGPDSPSHFYNFTSKSIRDRAKIAVAEGRGGEFFTSRKNRTSTVPVAKPTETVYALPAKVAALLPAIAMKLGVGADVSLKDFIRETSFSASKDNEAKLSDSVLEVFRFFGMDGDNEAQNALLGYAGVKTRRAIQIERIQETIKVLSNIKLDSLTNDRLSDLERCLLSFALTGETETE